MFTSNTLDYLGVAQLRVHELRAEAADERLCSAPPRRRALAALLRQTADRLDPAPLAPRTAA